MQGKWRNGELSVLFHCTHQIIINHIRSATPWIIMHIFASFIQVSRPCPYHWITHGMFSIHLRSWQWMSAGFMFLAFKKRITDRISHVAGFSIFSNIVNTQDNAQTRFDWLQMASMPSKRTNKLCTHAHSDCSAAAPIFANRTYFVDMPRS
jgi:hypothetical protein